MKKQFLLLILVTTTSIFTAQSALAKGTCNCPPSGPPGLTASPAFGSFYTTISQSVPLNGLINFPTILTTLEIEHPNNTDFVIPQDGFYFIEYGASNTGESNRTTLAMYINNTAEIFPSRLSLPVDDSLVTVSFITPFAQGDVLNVLNVVDAFELGVSTTLSSPPIKAFLTIMYVGPLTAP